MILFQDELNEWSKNKKGRIILYILIGVKCEKDLLSLSLMNKIENNTWQRHTNGSTVLTG